MSLLTVRRSIPPAVEVSCTNRGTRRVPLFLFFARAPRRIRVTFLRTRYHPPAARRRYCEAKPRVSSAGNILSGGALSVFKRFRSRYPRNCWQIPNFTRFRAMTRVCSPNVGSAADLTPHRVPKSGGIQ